MVCLLLECCLSLLAGLHERYLPRYLSRPWYGPSVRIQPRLPGKTGAGLFRLQLHNELCLSPGLGAAKSVGGRWWHCSILVEADG